MTLLTIVKDACKEIGLPVPSVVTGSSDDNVVQLERLANKEGKELIRRYDWQVLQTEQTFTSVATETQTGMVASDLDHFINETFFNRTAKRHFVGPLTPQEWQVQKSVISTVVIDSFRRRGDDILVLPVPSAGDTFVYEYVSNTWVNDVSAGAGNYLTAFGADADTSRIDEELITLGVIWRYKQARGFDYAEDFRTYEMRFARVTGDDGAARTMDLGKPRLRRVRTPYLPEGSWSV